MKKDGRWMSGKPPKRDQVAAEDRWAVEAIFKTDEEWESAFRATEDYGRAFQAWAGRLGESPESLAGAIAEMLAQQRALEKLGLYAGMRQDEDLSNALHSSMDDRCTARRNEVAAAQSFFMPELLSIDPAVMAEWLRSPALEGYATWLEEMLRYRPHTLSEPEEKLLAMSGDALQGFHAGFGKLNNVDMPARLPEITDQNGRRTKLTNSNLVPLMEESDPWVRRAAFDGYYRELSGNLNTAAALLNGQVKSHIFMAKARRHASALEASLFHDLVSTEVYRALIDAVHNRLPVMHGYYAAKKSALGLDTLSPCDLYLPAVRYTPRRYSYDEAVDMTLEAVRPLGGRYVSDLAEGFRSGWVDRYENVGKRSGAYSTGCVDSMPYILHNFSGTLDSVFTLAHEAGHSMHSLMSWRHQPYHMSDYRILVAEVASTTNEMLLADMLMKKSDDDGMKAYLLDRLVNDFRTTLFRQTMFAEFEWLIHREVEEGGALTPEFLNSKYLELVRLYHGEALNTEADDAMIAAEWARIPHFYYNFYVYKYATGLSSAVALSRRILEGRPGALDAYLGFLSAGSSRRPLEILRDAGVDLETPAPVNEALDYLAETVDRLGGMMS